MRRNATNVTSYVTPPPLNLPVRARTHTNVLVSLPGTVTIKSDAYLMGGFHVEPNNASGPGNYVHPPLAGMGLFTPGNIGVQNAPPVWNEEMPELPKALGHAAVSFDAASNNVIVATGQTVYPVDEQPFGQPDPADILDTVFTYNPIEGAWRSDTIPRLPAVTFIDQQPLLSEYGGRASAAGAVCGNGTASWFFLVGGRHFSCSTCHPSYNNKPTCAEKTDPPCAKWVVLGNTTGYPTASIGQPPTWGKWSEYPQMRTPRADHTLVCSGNTLYAIGGTTHEQPGTPAKESHDDGIHLGNYALGSVEMMDLSLPQANWSWTTMNSGLHVPRLGLAATVANEKIYVMGGYMDSYVTTVESLDVSAAGRIANAGWQYETPMLSARGYLGSSVINNTLCTFGGLCNDDHLGISCGSTECAWLS